MLTGNSTTKRFRLWGGFTMLALAAALGIGLYASNASAGAPSGMPSGVSAQSGIMLDTDAAPARPPVERLKNVPEEVGDLLFSYNVETTTTPIFNVALGVEHVAGVYYVTGRSLNDNIKKVVRLDLDGNFLSEFVQEACATATFGYRDLAFDGANLVTADECGIDIINPTTGMTVTSNIPNPTGVTVVRALAYDPVTGEYFTANFGTAITVFTIGITNTTVVRTLPNPRTPASAIYGLAFDRTTAGNPYLWTWSQDGVNCATTGFCGRALRVNPTTGALNGEFDGSSPYPGLQDIAGGADIDIISSTLTFIGLQQTLSDTIRGYNLTLPFGTPTNTPTPTFTPTATNTVCPSGVQTVSGSLAAGDPTQNGRMTRNAVASTCAVPKAYPGTFNATILRYDSYTFTNNNPGTACFTVSTSNTCANNVFLAAYLNSYDPTNIALNYLADAGSSGAAITFSFNVPALANFVIVAHEVSATGCVGYSITISGFSCSLTPQATFTPTDTRTPTFTRTATATATCPPLYRTVGRDAAPGEVGPLHKAAPGENTFQAAGQSGKQSAKAGRISSPDAPVDFILDDGTRENSIGFGSATTETAAIWLNRFTPLSSTYPITLKTIQVLWPQQTGTEQLIGKTIRLLVYADTDGDGNPSNATRIGDPITVTVGFTGTFQSYPAPGVTATGPGDLYIGFEDYFAEPFFVPRLFPASIDTDPPSQVRSWVAGMSAGGPPDITNLGANTVLGTIESASGGALTGNWMIRATGNNSLPDPCAPSGIVNGHLTWNGISQPNTRNIGLTATVTLCNAGVPVNYTVTCDTSGNFSLTSGLPDGTYNWRIKGPRHLANSGSLTIVGGVISQEFGKQKAGDTNNSNVVNTTDFNLLKNTLGKTGCPVPDPGWDPRNDFNNDCLVNTTDFNLQRNNFGQGGAATNCP